MMDENKAENKILITPATMVAELLTGYPELEDKLIELAPVFKKLKNPVLRKTIAKVTTLKQAAVIGNIDLGHLINSLRKEIGEKEIKLDATPSPNSHLPNWINEEKIVVTYDARSDLDKGIHPLAKVTAEASEMKDDEIYLFITPFVPAPLVKILEEKGFKVYSKNVSPNQFNNYVKKDV